MCRAAAALHKFFEKMCIQEGSLHFWTRETWLRGRGEDLRVVAEQPDLHPERPGEVEKV